MLVVLKFDRERRTIIALLHVAQAANEISAATHEPAPVVACALARGDRQYTPGYDYEPAAGGKRGFRPIIR